MESAMVVMALYLAVLHLHLHLKVSDLYGQIEELRDREEQDAPEAQEGCGGMMECSADW